MRIHSIVKQSRFKLAMAAAIAAATICAPVSAVNDTATATATVIVPIAITKATDMNFGKFAAGAGGTITVSNSGARTVSGVILSAIGTTPAAAKFDITGEPNATYSISFAGSDATLSDGASHTMAIATTSDLTGANVVAGNVSTGTLSALGAESLYVGATLTVGAAQEPGVYTGAIIATVEYN